jgi:hypothetical protein
MTTTKRTTRLRPSFSEFFRRCEESPTYWRELSRLGGEEVELEATGGMLKIKANGATLWLSRPQMRGLHRSLDQMFKAQSKGKAKR